MNVPVPKDFAPARVGMDGAGIGMSSRCLSAMHFLLRARRPYGLLKNMIAVAWMHRIVAIAVKNDSRDSRPVTYLVIGPVGIERGVGLNDVLDGPTTHRADRAPQRRHHARRDGRLKAQGIPDCDH